MARQLQDWRPNLGHRDLEVRGRTSAHSRSMVDDLTVNFPELRLRESPRKYRPCTVICCLEQKYQHHLLSANRELSPSVSNIYHIVRNRSGKLLPTPFNPSPSALLRQLPIARSSNHSSSIKSRQIFDDTYIQLHHRFNFVDLANSHLATFLSFEIVHIPLPSAASHHHKLRRNSYRTSGAILSKTPAS